MVRKLDEISDGKLYDIQDQVKAGTEGCNGCSACCHDVGDLVVLTPYDVYEIRKHLEVELDQLMDVKMALREEKKIKLPYLKMTDKTLACSFLNKEGRCSIHKHRPNICRLFPLGRVYEDNDFKYFLQINSCLKPQLRTVTISDWLEIENYAANKTFIILWHQLLKALTFRLKFIRDEKELDLINTYLLETFYNFPLEEDFYTTFNKRLPEAKKHLGIL